MKKNEMEKVCIKNGTCCFFDDMINLEDFDLDNSLIEEKSHKNILIDDISYKNLIGSKHLRVRFDKIERFIRIYDGNRYFTLFGSEKYDAIYNRIRYLVSLKSGITYFLSHYFAEIKLDSYGSLPIEKILTLQNVIIHIKSILNKDKNYYYCNIFLEKCSHQLTKTQSQICFL